MVGKRTYTTDEIVFVLDKKKNGATIDEIYTQHFVCFPNRPHKDGKKGIEYVWNKYKDDPSFIQTNFSASEIAFILGWEMRKIEGNIHQEISNQFEKEFPDRDWQPFVNKTVAIESVIARNRTNPYFFIYETKSKRHENMVCFLQRARMKLYSQRSWEYILQEVLKRWPQESKGINLQVLHAKHQLRLFCFTPDREDDSRDEWSPEYEDQQYGPYDEWSLEYEDQQWELYDEGPFERVLRPVDSDDIDGRLAHTALRKTAKRYREDDYGQEDGPNPPKIGIHNKLLNDNPRFADMGEGAAAKKKARKDGNAEERCQIKRPRIRRDKLPCIEPTFVQKAPDVTAKAAISSWDNQTNLYSFFKQRHSKIPLNAPYGRAPYGRLGISSSGLRQKFPNAENLRLINFGQSTYTPSVPSNGESSCTAGFSGGSSSLRPTQSNIPTYTGGMRPSFPTSMAQEMEHQSGYEYHVAPPPYMQTTRNVRDVSDQERLAGEMRNIDPSLFPAPNYYANNMLEDQPIDSLAQADPSAFPIPKLGWSHLGAQRNLAMHQDHPAIQTHMQAFSRQSNFTSAQTHSVAWQPDFIPDEYHFVPEQHNFTSRKPTVIDEALQQVVQSGMLSAAIDVMGWRKGEHFQTGPGGIILPSHTEPMQDRFWKQISATPLDTFGNTPMDGVYENRTFRSGPEARLRPESLRQEIPEVLLDNIPEDRESQMPHTNQHGYLDFLPDGNNQEEASVKPVVIQNALNTTEDPMLYPGSMVQDASSANEFSRLVGKTNDNTEPPSHEDLYHLYETMYGWQEEALDATEHSINTMEAAQDSMPNRESNNDEATKDEELDSQFDLEITFEAEIGPQEEQPKGMNVYSPNSPEQLEIQDGGFDGESGSDDDLSNFFEMADGQP